MLFESIFVLQSDVVLMLYIEIKSLCLKSP